MSQDAFALLCAGYLNLDWDVDYPTVWDAVSAFRAHEDRRTVEQAVHTIQTLLETKDEQALCTYLRDEVGCGYWPPGEGKSCRDWLADVAHRLST